MEDKINILDLSIKDEEFIYEIHKMMSEKQLMIIYNGHFTQEITKAFLSMAKKNLEKFEEGKNVKKKVFHIMVECLQNIYKHSDQDIGAKPNVSTFAVGKVNSEYHILSGNLVSNNKVESLINLLNKINGLDKEGLLTLFKKTMSEGVFSDKGGAGLGLIDMAKKSGNKLIYKFDEVDDNYSFFSLRTVIKSQKN